MYSLLDFAQKREWISRGIGKTQQAILDELSAGHLAVAELAERLGVSDRRIRHAVHALAGRDLINLYKVTTQREWISRGIGKTQQAILDELSAGHLAVAELAERLGVSDRQIRHAVHALADRDLINLYKVTTPLPNGRFTPVKLFVEKPSHQRELTNNHALQCS